MTSFMMENSLRVTFLPPILQQKFTMPAWKHHHVFTSVVGCWTSYQQRGGLARRHEYIFYYRKRQVSTLLYVPDRWTFSQRVLCFLGSGSKLWVKLHSIGLLHSKDVTTKQNADGCRDKKKMNCFEQMTNWIQTSSSQKRVYKLSGNVVISKTGADTKKDHCYFCAPVYGERSLYLSANWSCIKYKSFSFERRKI